MRTRLVAASAVMITAIASSLHAQQASPRYCDVREADAPQIDLWLDQVTYRYGDHITPFFDTEPGAYVTVVRVTTDGQLTVLYPRRPKDQEPYERSQLVSNRIPYNSFDGRFNVNESDGIGFVFAIASYNKFNYSYFTQGGTWNWGRLAYEGGIGDPFEILHRFVDRTLGENADFSMDYMSYRVTNYGTRSRYATRYSFNTYDDYYDACTTAFGLRYTSYCRNGYPGYYGPIVVSQPPSTSNPDVPTSGRRLGGKKIKPVTGDPIVGGAPVGPEERTEGRLPVSDPAEGAAEAAHRDRMRRAAWPRDRDPSQVETVPIYRSTPAEQPQRAEPSPRTEPNPQQFMQQPMIRPEPRVVEPQRIEPRPEPQRIEPRIEPRIEQRIEPRPEPRVIEPARVEVRVEPPAPAPAPAPAPVIRTTATPATKDQN